MKKRKFFVAALILGAASIGTYSVTQKYNKTELSDLALANIEALAQGEGSSTGYCTMHIPCYDSNGLRTGLYAGISYPGPNCNGPYHQHTCSTCNQKP